MKTVNLIQGSLEWHAHRAAHFNASDAPAMLGISPYKSRTQLLQELATGITPEVDAATQRRFDDGHRFEALARPLAEAIIGDELSPIVGTVGRLSASFDGITFDESVIFEHKTLNDKLREAEFGDDGYYLPEDYRAQMEHQLMVSDAGKCLFMASKWAGDELVEEHHCWYISDQNMRDRLLQGWTQFSIDLEEHKRKLAAGEIEQPKVAPKADVIKALPSVFVQATGMVTASNLEEFAEAATSFIAAIKTELVSDQDFADAESTVKFCKEAEANLEATKAGVLAQMTTVDEVTRTLDHIAAQLRDKRLMLDKLVKSEKEARKLAIVSKAANDYTAHIESLEAETRPIQMNVNRPNFGEAIKGLKSLSSMQEKVDTALRDGKFDADKAAKDVRDKLAWCKEHAAGMSMLFPDLQNLISMEIEGFKAIIKNRIAEHKREEQEREAAIRAKAEADAAAKLESERAAMQAEEERKAREKVAAEQEEQRQRILASAKEEAEKEDAAQALSQNVAEAVAETGTAVIAGGTVLSAKDIFAPENTQAASVVGLTRSTRPSDRPSDPEIIRAIAESFNVSNSQAARWIIEVAEAMEQAA